MMSHPKARLIVALVATTIFISTSTSSAHAADKKKSFTDLLSPSVSTATASTPAAPVVSAEAKFAGRAVSNSSGIQATTARPPGLSLSAYRALVYAGLVKNQSNLIAALQLYRSELRNGTITRAQFIASRLNAFHIFTGYSAGLNSEYSSGTPYYFTTRIGLGPQAIQPGPLYVSPVTPSIVPPLTSIR